LIFLKLIQNLYTIV